MRCDVPTCVHCSSLPSPSSAFLAIKQMPFALFFSPTPSQQPNHFLSFLEMMRANQLRDQNFAPAYPDEHCPSQHTVPQPHKVSKKISKQPPERCSCSGCKNYCFSSFSDYVKHMRLLHPSEWAADSKAIRATRAASAKKVPASVGIVICSSVFFLSHRMTVNHLMTLMILA